VCGGSTRRVVGASGGQMKKTYLYNLIIISDI